MKRAFTFGILTIVIIIFTSFRLFDIPENKSLVILHTNDIHSQLESFSQNEAKSKAGKGGIVRIGNFIKAVRDSEDNVLVLDAGDFCQGTPYYNLYHGDAEIDAMNAIGYDVATFGNHEFDMGLDNLKRLVKRADFPFVNANYDFSGTVLEGLVKPYIIIQKQGLRIGILGIGTNLRNNTLTENIQGIKFKDTFASANEVADILRNQEKCDLVICLSHIGFTGKHGEINDSNLAKQSTDIDIIVGGHSHTYLETPQVVKNKNKQDVYIVQTGSSSLNVGRLNVEFEKIR